MTRPALAQGQASGCGSPVLDVYTTVAGQRVDAAVVQFIIWERVTNPLVPTQVYPPVGRQDLNVLELCPDGDRLGLGHYVAAWDVPVDALIGAYAIQWFFKLTPASDEYTLVEDFDVVALVGTSDASLYCSIDDVRAEGVSIAAASDDRVLRKISVASRLIDKWTGRWFYPRELELTLDGRGISTLRFGAPIISISSVVIDYFLTDPAEGYEVNQESIEVYNRHITQGLTDPDDRNDPRITIRFYDEQRVRLATPGPIVTFPKGKQNVLVRGVFGYTEQDLSTPILIREACISMTLLELSPKAKSLGVGTGLIKREKTREQEIEYGDPTKSAIQGAFTGDPKIDMILAAYRRPPALGAV
jgi:hypothetical protein